MNNPVIVVTDLYHPPQDPGDNFDLITAFALPGVDLKAVILDVTEEYRHIYEEHPIGDYHDRRGPREPGIIPVSQLCYLFGRNVPYAMGPFRRMRSPEDTFEDAPKAQQLGIQLILDTLRASTRPVQILSFGSARTIAAAYNREPDLMRAKVGRIHLSAGSDTDGYLSNRPGVVEWNIHLDPHAVVRLLRSDLPVAIYPCATHEGGFAYGRHNSYWKLPNLEFIRDMQPELARYLCYAFSRSGRVDFLRALEEDPPQGLLDQVCASHHHVWETAVWINASGSRLVRRADGTYRIVHHTQLQPGDTILPNELLPCTVNVHDDGRFAFEIIGEGAAGDEAKPAGCAVSSGPSNFWIYDRHDPYENEAALREALPALYRSFRV